MEVILLESFNKLGKIGDIVNVKDGFARNYLIPQKKALRANKDNKDHFTKIKKELIEKNNKIIEEAKKSLEKFLAKKLSSLEMQVITDNYMDPCRRKIFPTTLTKNRLTSNHLISTYTLQSRR